MAKARSKVVRGRINSLNHMAAVRADMPGDGQRQERGALLWAVAIIEAAIEIGTYHELEVVARMGIDGDAWNERGAVVSDPPSKGAVP